MSVQAKVQKLGQKGDGVIEAVDDVLHVPKVLAGETVELEGGALLRVIEASPERIEPFCPFYAHCGGCKFQHWREDAYRAWKRGLLVSALKGQGIAAEVNGLIDAHGAGRRRVSLHVRRIEGTWCAGFMKQETHDLCAIDHCPICVPELQRAPEIAAAIGAILGDCDVAVTAAANGLDVSVRAQRKAVERRVPHLLDILHENRLARLSVNNEEVAAREQPFVFVGGVKVPLPLQSFLQATAEGEATLTRLVMEGLPRAKHIADLFCGIGTFALPLAAKARISAFDSDKPAIASLSAAVRNATGLKPVSAAVRNLFNAPLTFQELRDFDAVILDPPRAGAEAQARQLARSSVAHVAYVSCEVASFARDAAILLAGDYALKSVTPVDQFKWSAHLELVAHFVKR